MSVKLEPSEQETVNREGKRRPRTEQTPSCQSFIEKVHCPIHSDSETHIPTFSVSNTEEPTRKAIKKSHYSIEYECCVCLDSYQLRNMRALSCGHTLCGECTNAMLKQVEIVTPRSGMFIRESVVCPFCQKHTFHPQKIYLTEVLKEEISTDIGVQ
jgi:hypothetical protein